MNKQALTEADIRSKFITPALVGVNGEKWNLHTQIREEVYLKTGTPENFPPPTGLIPPHAWLLAPEPGARPAHPGARGAKNACLARSVRERTRDDQAAQVMHAYRWKPHGGACAVSNLHLAGTRLARVSKHVTF